MNGQTPVKREWPDVVNDLKVSISNGEMQLELLKAQLKRAEEHARGK